jgi:DNA-binding SARP family transcriptional activator
MSTLRIQLFGKLSVESDGRSLEGLDANKAQELFCYLLVNRDRPHPRESLAALLWGEAAGERSKKYLRQSLWQLQGVLDTGGARSLLSAEHDWVRLESEGGLWLDVEAFERASRGARGESGVGLSPEQKEALAGAVALYRGDLLEGWYQDWCLYERERLQNLYLLMLDKLMSYCERRGDYDEGQHYGALSLRHDRARERTHRRLMRMHHASGDRTSALRQYERCAAALKEELSVAPDRRTNDLYRRIRAGEAGRAEPPSDAAGPPAAAPPRAGAGSAAAATEAARVSLPDAARVSLPDAARISLSEGARVSLSEGARVSLSEEARVAPPDAARVSLSDAAPVSLAEVLARLQQLQQVVGDVQQRIQRDIKSVELTLRQKAGRVLNRHG